ncbi:nucleolar protein 58-like [Contarinia nasturtii]|uniref:nucleolar protein 58-like n=1 Tax=Contarinia nasturtii TaxID=265458 RepID=UPI0012D3F8E8|nr:nucleolar protein 58-like [Contarinia nasturtii]
MPSFDETNMLDGENRTVETVDRSTDRPSEQDMTVESIEPAEASERKKKSKEEHNPPKRCKTDRKSDQASDHEASENELSKEEIAIKPNDRKSDLPSKDIKDNDEFGKDMTVGSIEPEEAPKKKEKKKTKEEADRLTDRPSEQDAPNITKRGEKKKEKKNKQGRKLSVDENLTVTPTDRPKMRNRAKLTNSGEEKIRRDSDLHNEEDSQSKSKEETTKTVDLTDDNSNFDDCFRKPEPNEEDLIKGLMKANSKLSNFTADLFIEIVNNEFPNIKMQPTSYEQIPSNYVVAPTDRDDIQIVLAGEHYVAVHYRHGEDHVTIYMTLYM